MHDETGENLANSLHDILQTIITEPIEFTTTRAGTVAIYPNHIVMVTEDPKEAVWSTIFLTGGHSINVRHKFAEVLTIIQNNRC